MRTIKIEIRPEVRAFNQAIERCDFITAYAFDRKPAAVLLDRVKQMRAYPWSVLQLEMAIDRLVTIKQ